jgi:hypothetical protein
MLPFMLFEVLAGEEVDAALLALAKAFLEVGQQLPVLALVRTLGMVYFWRSGSEVSLGSGGGIEYLWVVLALLVER